MLVLIKSLNIKTLTLMLFLLCSAERELLSLPQDLSRSFGSQLESPLSPQRSLLERKGAFSKGNSHDLNRLEGTLVTTSQVPLNLTQELTESFGSQFELPPSPLAPRLQRRSIARRGDFARGSADDLKRIEDAITFTQQELLYQVLVQMVISIGFRIRHAYSIQSLLWKFAKRYYKDSEAIQNVLHQLPKDYTRAYSFLQKESFFDAAGNDLWPNEVPESQNRVLKKKLFDLLKTIDSESPELHPLRHGSTIPSLTMPPAN